MENRTPDSGSIEARVHHPHHYHLRKTTQKLKHLIHPDGRKLHVAHTPAEADQLRRNLTQECRGDEDIHVYLSGTDEHLHALREIQAHHEERCNKLRDQHGEVFDEAEAVILELETLSEELRHVTQRAVQLDPAFAKYGYSKNIRTHGDSPNESSTPSLSSGKTGQQTLEEWHALRFQGQPMKPWRKPILRQYMHKNLLWRAQEAEEVASYELFLDLIYVGIIAISGDSAAEHANGETLLRFAITFIMSWKIWTDLTQLINWFDQDDLIRRIFVLFTLACLVGFTTNITEYDHYTYTPLVAFYLASRLAFAAYYVWTAWLIPMIKWPLVLNAAIIVIPSAIWIASIHVEGWNRQIPIWIALGLDVFGTPALVMLRFLGRLGTFGKDCVEKIFAFWPGQNIEHRIDRTGAFVTLVFGYSVVSLLYQSASHIGANAFLGKAILGLMQAFALNTLYFEIDSYNLHIHAIRRHVASALTWFTLHLPLMLAYVIAGAALSRLVLVHDTESASLENLAEPSQLKSEEEMSEGLRWFYCAGLGIATLCLNGIGYCHSYRSVSLAPDQRFPWAFKRPVRLAFRVAVSIAIIFLGFAEHLSSLELISTTAGLIWLSLVVEVIGATLTGCAKRRRRSSILSGSTLGSHHSHRSHHGHIGLKELWAALKSDWCPEKRCAYRARCHQTKKDLEARQDEKGRGVITLEELLLAKEGEIRDEKVVSGGAEDEETTGRDVPSIVIDEKLDEPQKVMTKERESEVQKTLSDSDEGSIETKTQKLHHGKCPC